MTWNEPRLIKKPSHNSRPVTTIDNSFADSLWLPDTYVYDMVKADFNVAGESELCLRVICKHIAKSKWS